MFTKVKLFFALVAEDAKALGRERLSMPFCLMALLGLNRFSAVFLHRVEAALFLKGFPLTAFSRLASRWNGLWNSCEISPLAKIGPGFCLPHPTGVVIGTILAGKNLTVLQNATIALKDRGLASDDFRNFPSFGDNVVVGAGAAVLGDIVIGDGAVIGSNAVVIIDVPAGCLAVGNPARVIAPRSKAPSRKLNVLA